MGLHVLLCKYREMEERMSLSIRELVAILLESSELHSSDRMGDRGIRTRDRARTRDLRSIGT